MGDGGVAGAYPTRQSVVLMPMYPRDIPITRDMVQQWVRDWRTDGEGISLDDWLKARVADLDLPDDLVMRPDSEPIPISEMILDDLASYGVPD